MLISGLLFILKKRFYIQLNRYVLKLKGVSFGSKCTIYFRFKLSKGNKSNILLGDNLIITSGNFINPLCKNLEGIIYAEENSVIRIGNNVGMSSPSIWVKEKLIIGNNVNIGANCYIIDNDAHSLDYRIRNKTITDESGKSIDHSSCQSAPIIIEDDVWIGLNCIILKGVTLGARSIIGAGSVVKKSVPPDSVVAGNPAKVIKSLIS